MPWKVETVMSRRKELVTLAVSEGVNMSELCRREGVSRKTGHKWLRRYREQGESGLDDLSRRPHRSPNRTSDEMEQAVVDLRREHPAKGSHVLAQMLKDRRYDGVPSKSTVTAILRRHGLIDPAESSKHQPYKRFEHAEPNQLWQMDFKGHIAITKGRRCHPLTVLDDHSRFSLGVRACGNETTQTVRDHLTPIFRHYGMPDTMLMDNGSPWGSDLDHPFTPLSVWLAQLGVRVVHSRPYHPQTLGKLERFHRSLKAELLQGRTYTDLADRPGPSHPHLSPLRHARHHADGQRLALGQRPRPPLHPTECLAGPARCQSGPQQALPSPDPWQARALPQVPQGRAAPGTDIHRPRTLPE